MTETQYGCFRCNRPFRVGDELVMVVTRVEENGHRLEYVPVHLSCQQSTNLPPPNPTRPPG